MPGGTIAVASDHAGFDLKESLKGDLQAAGFEAVFGKRVAAETGCGAMKALLSTSFDAVRQVGRVAKFSKGCTP